MPSSPERLDVLSAAPLSMDGGLRLEHKEVDNCSVSPLTLQFSFVDSVLVQAVMVYVASHIAWFEVSCWPSTAASCCKVWPFQVASAV